VCIVQCNFIWDSLLVRRGTSLNSARVRHNPRVRRLGLVIELGIGIN